MKRAVEQETLQALAETGAAREFRVLREAWRLDCASAASGYQCARGANRSGTGVR